MDDKLRILLCEDDENLGMLLREYLQAKGYNADLFPDGEVGFKAFLKSKYDLVVTDVMMPRKDGFTLAQEIRQANAEVPIIFLTAKTLKEDILEGFKIGADDYITKPFSATYLKARVKNLLVQRQKLQVLYRQDLMSAGMAIPVSDEQTEKRLTYNPESDKSPVMSPNDRKFMDRLVEFMEKNMDNGELIVDDFVHELAVSRSVFFKKLKTLTGLAPIEFIKEMRINRAVQLIETGEYSMTQISYMVGINDPRYFSKCFKQKKGMTPTEYRDKVLK